jgi:Zn-dependent protease
MQNSVYLKLVSIPLRIHWSVALAIPIAVACTGRLVAGLLAACAFTFMLLAHELGHAFMAWRCKLATNFIDLYLFHGLCSTQAPRTDVERVCIAWGGVLAQLVLLILALLVSQFVALPSALGPAFFVLIAINILTVAQNLIPVKPLDGVHAWGVLPLLWHRLIKDVPGALFAKANKKPSTPTQNDVGKSRKHLKVIK